MKKRLFSVVLIIMMVLISLNIEASGIKLVSTNKSILYSNVSSVKNDIENKQIIVVYKEGSKAGRSSFLSHSNNIIKAEKVSKRVDVLQLQGAEEVERTIEELRQDPNVESIGKNFTRRISSVPNDLRYSDQWHYANVGADQTWNQVSAANEVVVAVIDTGIDVNHPDLVGKIKGGYDYFSNDSIPEDLVGHGTMVSGIISAVSNNEIGVSGLTGTSNVKIMPFKTGGTQNLEGDAIVSSIYAAISNNVDIINMSYGAYDEVNPFNYDTTDLSDPEYVAMQAAYQAGILLVAASGNEGDDIDDPNDPDDFDLKGAYCYPASYKNVISVGATDRYNIIAGFSQYNKAVDISAPGVSIISTYKGGIYNTQSGTSFAAPVLAGCAAVLIAQDQSLTPFQVEDILKVNADDLGAEGKDNYYGVGKVNLIKSLQSLTQTSTPVPTSTSTPIPTSIPSSTPTATPTSTPTSTPIPTSTPTATPISTPISTPTATPTSTPTSIPTATPTPTSTATPTPTPNSTIKPTATTIPTPTTNPQPIAKKYILLENSKLYEKASIKSKNLISLKVGNNVAYKGVQGSYYKIKYKGKTGYVKKTSIKIQGRWTKTTKDIVSARLGPGTQYKIKETYKKGYKLWLVEQRGEWCKIYNTNYWINIFGLK